MKKKGSILIIEDEEGLLLSLEDMLISEGFDVKGAFNGLDGEKLALQNHFDLILLDVMLPGKDGFQVCKSIRRQGLSVPVLMLTARNTATDTVLGLQLGADDYLAKPFDHQVLLARIEALLRRANYQHTHNNTKVIKFGDFTLDTRRQELRQKGTPVSLNAQEYRLLKFFACNPGRILSRNELLDEVWGYDSSLTSRTVDVHIAWLRQRLEEKEVPRHIRTVRGYGYKFLLNPEG